MAMFCSKCGKECTEGTSFCANCGNKIGSTATTPPPVNPQQNYNQPNYNQPPQYPPYQQPYQGYQGYQRNINDTGSAGWGCLGFMFPIVGLILYLVWRNEQPLNARSAGKGALISVILYAVFVVIYVIIIISVASSYATYYNISSLVH